MNFLYDLTASQSIGGHDYHGGGKYAKKVFIALVAGMPNKWKLFGLYDSSKKLDEGIKAIVNSSSMQLIDIKGKSVAASLSEFNIERFYSALPFSHAYDFLSLFQTNVAIYGTIHGLRPLELSESFGDLKSFSGIKNKIKVILKILFKRLFWKKEHRYFERLLEKLNTITVSNHTKYAIASYYPAASDSIPVFYSPDVTEFNEGEENEDEILNESDYFLLIGGSRWIKNNLRSAMALDMLFTERPYMRNKVIITGIKQPELYLNKLKNKNRFIFLGYVSERHLKYLYKNAFAFIYMSLNEGFGYPPLEAMKYGTPVIASPFTSIPEICGDAVLYGNPYSVEEIKNRILQLEDAKTYSRLVISGQQQYRKIKDKQDQDLSDMVSYLFK